MSAVYKQLIDDMFTGDRQWREVDEEWYEQMRDAVPPIRLSGSCYLSGEPYVHTALGEGVYFACFRSGDSYHGIMAITREWDAGRLAVGVNLPKLPINR